MKSSNFTANETLEQRVLNGLLKINLALKSHSWQAAELQGLTPTQGQILEILGNQSETGISLSEVAEKLAISSPTASEAVTTLVEKGLVEKERAVHDRRVIALYLTPKGREQAQQASAWTEFLLKAIKSLSEQEQEFLFRALVKVIKVLQDQGQIPVSRMCVTCRYFRPYLYDDELKPHHCALVGLPFGDRDLRLQCPDHQVS